MTSLYICLILAPSYKKHIFKEIRFCYQVIRHYHGHLSAVYCLALHPTIDVLVTAGRDSTARVWDMRTKVHLTTNELHSIIRL